MRKLIKAIILRIGSIIKHDASSKVVFYHDIGTKYTTMGTDANIFMKHMKILGSRGEMHDIVCFDDGFRGAWDYRELLPHGAKIFIAPSLVGKPGYLTWDEIRALNSEYGVDFQSHTWSHQTLVGPWNEDDVPREERTEEWYKRELVGSRLRLEEELGKPVDELCFPVGYFSEEVIERCKKAGYKKVYASYPGNITDDYVQPRCLVQDLSPWAFKAVLNGGMNSFTCVYLKKHFKD